MQQQRYETPVRQRIPITGTYISAGTAMSGTTTTTIAANNMTVIDPRLSTGKTHQDENHLYRRVGLKLERRIRCRRRRARITNTGRSSGRAGRRSFLSYPARLRSRSRVYIRYTSQIGYPRLETSLDVMRKNVNDRVLVMNGETTQHRSAYYSQLKLSIRLLM